jgi:hypothetical protein
MSHVISGRKSGVMFQTRSPNACAAQLPWQLWCFLKGALHRPNCGLLARDNQETRRASARGCRRADSRRGTPLLTYRDPLSSDAGPLSADEQALKNTSLKDFFFHHLASIGSAGQFLVVENVDLPASVAGLAHVETFTGDVTSGRAGLFA